MATPARAADLDWTVERAHALPDDGNRYEVLDGELFVTPAPTWRHQGARADRYRKRAIYMQEDVGEYWIIDAGQRLIERWGKGDSEPEIVTGELVWTPREGMAPFTLDVAEFFAEVDRYPRE